MAKFKLTKYQPPDMTWGAPLNVSDIEGQWNGMINEVMQGRADFSHAAFSTTLERARVISFGNPYYKDA